MITIKKNTAFQLRLWLYLVAALIALMVLVGGATRLTESGLSITEWKPVSGALPPMNTAEWQSEFQKYQATTEYSQVNKGMSLEEFKRIYWWEWGHRFLGRLIGIVFALPFFYFLLAGKLSRPLALKLTGILVLGGLQGAIGWWMVKSGLAGRVDVAPYRLAVHLTLALFIFALVLRVAFSLNKNNDRHARTRVSACAFPSVNSSGHLKPLDPRFRGDDAPTWLLLALIFLQIFLGGLVAGSRAGYVYNSWPLMDGRFVPEGLLTLQPWWRNFFENTALVQFLHRVNAYVLIVLAVVNLLRRRSKYAMLIFSVLFGQMMLGIATLVSEMNFALALMHQAGAVLVVAAAVHSLRGEKPALAP